MSRLAARHRTLSLSNSPLSLLRASHSSCTTTPNGRCSSLWCVPPTTLPQLVCLALEAPHPQSGATSLRHGVRAALVHQLDSELLAAQVMYPLCLVGDVFFMYHELKSMHLRTLNRDRAELLADRYLDSGAIRLPGDVARDEHIFLPSAFDRSNLTVRFVPIQELFDDARELEAASAACQGGFLLRLRRSGAARGPRGSDAALGGLRPPPMQCKSFLGIALHKDASHLQVLAAVLAACAARRQLQGMGPPSFGEAVHAGKWHAEQRTSPQWWGSNGALTAEAQQCVEQGRACGLRHVKELKAALETNGWICRLFMLAKSERVRFSTRLRRFPGNTRWVTFRQGCARVCKGDVEDT
jgi:hypothetical protein